MPWQEATTMSLREEFVMLATQHGANMRELCRRFQISPKTGYKWLDRYEREGWAGLADRSPRPHSSPTATPAEVEAKVVELRQRRRWGGRKLRRRLRELGYRELPSASTITAILHRHGLIEPEASQQAQPYTRFEHAAPNQLWQMDFKGHFATTTGRCHPLTVLDDHSRFNLALHACGDERGATVQAVLRDTFRRYGLPERLLMDNGAPWGNDAQHPLTPLTAWLIRLGIIVTHSRAYHPQTMGKDERFHRTVDVELIRLRHFYDLTECQYHFGHWRDIYNLERPHESLAMDVPAQHYQPSPRPFPETLPPIDYAPGDAVRKVQQGGYIWFQGHDFRISNALRGYPVAVRPTRDDGIYSIHFCHQKVAEIDLKRQYGEP